MLSITIYKVSKRKNSTLFPSGGTTVTGSLKGECSLLTPTLMLNYENDDFNMFDFGGRLYWVTDIRWIRNNLIEVTGSVDVLGSYKSSILKTNAFIAYASNGVNSMLPDNRIPMLSDTVRTTSTATLGEPFNSEGSFILGVIGTTQKPNAGGFINVYNMTQRECADLSVFFSQDVDAISRVSQQFGNAFGCLSYLKWIPITQQGSDLSQIYVGGEKSGVFGSLLETRHLFKTVYLSIPWYSSDYRKFEPYSHAVLYLPFVGCVELSLQDLAEIVTLSIGVVFDMYTGEIVYSIQNADGIAAVYKGDASVDLPMSTYQSNVTSKLGMIDTAATFGVESGAGIGLGAELLAKGAEEVVSNLGSALKTITPMKTGMIGGFSGSAGSRLSMDLKISVYTHGTSASPSSVRSVMGGPVSKVDKVGNYSGYVQCSQFKVNGNMTLEEQTMINNYMNGGVYIE